MSYSELFSKCVEILLKLEGGYSNRKSDKGGETNFGISSRSYPDINIKTLTRERAIEIYYNDYWIPMNIDRLQNDLLILHLFCFGVNAGTRTAIKILQKLVGAYSDGLIGSKTRKAIRLFEGNIAEEFIKREKLFYVSLVQHKPEQRVNLKGWLNRINNINFYYDRVFTGITGE